jgi:PDZ domain-containing secreted protein
MVSAKWLTATPFWYLPVTRRRNVPSVAVKLAAGPDTAREREKRARLSRQPLLAGCSTLTLRRIAAVADEITARPGDVLVQQGRHVFWFFLIQQGRADVVRDGSTIAQLRSGEYFGEVVLERGVQPATVVATTPMRLFVIGSQRFVPLAHDVRRLRHRLHVAPVRGRHLVRPLRLLRPARSPAPLPRRLVVVPPPRPRRRRVPFGLGVTTALLMGAALYHPPLAVIAPGPSFDVAGDVVITGIATNRPRGQYLLTTVASSRPTLIGVLATTFRINRQIVPVRRLSPSRGERRRARQGQAALFRDSRIVAAAAAARAAGLPVVVSPTGTSVADPGLFGLTLETSNLRVQLPFEIRFRERRVVGPSAGLAYALVVADMLQPEDLARGRRVAVTGEIDPEGQVQLVSYLQEKAAAGHRAGARVFIVPGAQAYGAAGHGMTVEGVSTLGEAVAALLAG